MCILFTAGLKESPENEPAVAALKRQEDEGMSFPWPTVKPLEEPWPRVERLLTVSGTPRHLLSGC